MAEQSLSVVKYSPSVRVGSWFDEYCLEEAEIQNFLTKRRSGGLLTQKTRNMFTNLLREIPLLNKEPNVHFGDIVQFVAASFKISTDFKKILPVLSIVITEKTILNSQKIDEGSEVTVAPSITACVRNTFYVKSADSIDRDGEVLKYGQHFVMESTQEGCPRYVLFSSQKKVNLLPAYEPTNVSMSGGEMNLPVGVCPKLSAECLPVIPSGHTRWMCQHLQPDLRFEYQGEPVPAETRMIITHVATNLNLAAENVEFQSFFGYECLASVHTYVDCRKRVLWKNIWTIKKFDENETLNL